MSDGPKKSWQDDKPWVVVDKIIEREQADKERAENNQKTVNISLNRFIAWIKSLFAVILLSSCSNFQYTATAPNGGTETIAYFTFGGSSAMESAGGTRLTQNHNKSYGQTMQAATAIAAGISAAYTKNSDNSLTATQSTNAANQAIQTTKANAAIEAAKIKATPTVVPEGQTVIFPP